MKSGRLWCAVAVFLAVAGCSKSKPEMDHQTRNDILTSLGEIEYGLQDNDATVEQLNQEVTTLTNLLAGIQRPDTGGALETVVHCMDYLNSMQTYRRVSATDQIPVPYSPPYDPLRIDLRPGTAAAAQALALNTNRLNAIHDMATAAHQARERLRMIHPK